MARFVRLINNLDRTCKLVNVQYIKGISVFNDGGRKSTYVQECHRVGWKLIETEPFGNSTEDFFDKFPTLEEYLEEQINDKTEVRKRTSR